MLPGEAQRHEASVFVADGVPNLGHKRPLYFLPPLSGLRFRKILNPNFPHEISQEHRVR